MKSFSGAALWIYLSICWLSKHTVGGLTLIPFKIFKFCTEFGHFDTLRFGFGDKNAQIYFQISLHLHNFNTQECFQKNCAFYRY